MLWGAASHIYTDHNDLIHATYRSQHVLSLRMFVEDCFKPQLSYRFASRTLRPAFPVATPFSLEVKKKQKH